MFHKERNAIHNRVNYELRVSGVKPNQNDTLNSGIHTRGYLPHVKREGGRYFVTFRLANSLPRNVFINLLAERDSLLSRLPEQPDEFKATHPKLDRQTIQRNIQRDYFRKLDECLDQGLGPCWLKRREVADMVARSLLHFSEDRYLLHAWVVMPNHVHLVLWPKPNHALSGIMQSLKRYTAREANKLLGQTGKAFWQPESYDHWIRSDEFARCCQYVVLNPVKARLCNAPEQWKWSSAWQNANSQSS